MPGMAGLHLKAAAKLVAFIPKMYNVMNTIINKQRRS
jgi:hypothetical protein